MLTCAASSLRSTAAAVALVELLGIVAARMSASPCVHDVDFADPVRVPFGRRQRLRSDAGSCVGRAAERHIERLASGSPDAPGALADRVVPITV